MTWFTSSTSNRPQYAEKVSMAAIFCAVVGGTFHFGRSAPVNSTHMCPSAVYINFRHSKGYCPHRKSAGLGSPRWHQDCLSQNGFSSGPLGLRCSRFAEPLETPAVRCREEHSCP